MKALFASAGLVAAIGLTLTPAQAHWRRHRRHYVRFVHHIRHAARPSVYAPPFSAVIVDANTGRTLYAKNQDELRHPASLTKVMTLYLLFEQLQKGRMSLNTEITVSPHAASMEPTKLGIPPGSRITVDDAVRAIVTKSANDMAVALAEAIGGSESHFAEMMTEKAHELGMTRTQYVNASGLPNPGQLTTAHDLAVLARSMQVRFPEYFHYFSTPSFRYDGQFMTNHDHLLGHVPGVDGMKTGFTDASGFNLMTDLRLNGRHLVGIVLGGPSWESRDRTMETLLAEYLPEASPRGSAAPIAETAVAASPDRSESPRAPTRPPVRAAAAQPPAPPRVSYASYEKPRPAFVASAPRGIADETPVTDSLPRGADDGSTGGEASSSATPEPLRWVVGPQPARLDGRRAESRSPERVAAYVPSVQKERAADSADLAPPAPAPQGIEIQIGATDNLGQAKTLLLKAKDQDHRALARATPFTQKVQRGDSTLWRARFAGLDEVEAEAACRQLKRSGFACFTLKD